MNAFFPSQHGFHFSNNDIKWSFGPFTGKALCGGMVYAALDYYLSGMHIPIDKTAPAEGTILHDYIYNRQVQAHKNTVPTFYSQFETAPKVRAEESLQTHGQLMSLVGSVPVPLCLTRIWKGHHVLAIGANAGAVPNILVYDPNFPDQFTALRRQGSVGSAPAWTHDISGETWCGLFVDDGYKRMAPNLICGEANWRWCVKCQALFWNGADGGKCPAGGGKHSPGGVKNYVIAVNDGHGEFGWRWCKDCQGMFFAATMQTSKCPVGNGVHHVGSMNAYVIPQDTGVGEGGWRRCNKCLGMFWSGSMGNGVCPGGGSHDPTGNYFLVSVKA